jgi:hypothetical protein
MPPLKPHAVLGKSIYFDQPTVAFCFTVLVYAFGSCN